MTKSSAITIGDELPDLTLRDDQERQVALRNLRGKTLVLYFYPKDSTPGCTTQACSLRDHWSEFEQIDNLVIYGVSPDSAASHVRFRAKHDLPFNLLVDEDHQLAHALGFWVEKSMYGKKYWGVERSTIVVNPDGFITAIARKVKPKEHTDWLRLELQR